MAHEHLHHAGHHHHNGDMGGGHHHGVGGTMATGAMLIAGSPAGRSFLGRLLTHPLVMFGLGAAAGYLAYRYRSEIIDAAMRASEMGKDFVLDKKETLEDLMEEAKERAEGGPQPA
jgi:hypothetical protein